MIGPSIGMLSPGLGLGPGDITCLRFLLLNHSGWKKIQRHPEPGLRGARNVQEKAFGLLLGALAAVRAAKREAGFPRDNVAFLLSRP